MFEPENEIERLLVRATTQPPVRAEFKRALMDGEVWVVLVPPEGVAIVPGPDGTGTVPQGTQFTLASADRAGEKVAAFFTAPSRARAWFKGDHFVAPNETRDLFERVPDASFVLNPGSDYGKEFTVADIKRLLAGQFGDTPQTITIDEPTPILLAHPKEMPDALIAALTRELAAVPSVNGAWLMLAIRGAAEPSWMLGVDHNGDWNDVRAAISRAVAGGVLEGRMLDATPLAGSSFADTLRTGIPVRQARRSFLSKLFR
jgi:SseB protein C-terminal domain/SseB protein N-terminal domain